MEAYNRFTKCIFEWERTLLKCIGHDFLAPKLKQTPMAFIIYGTLFVTFMLQAYTLVYYNALEKIYSAHTLSMLIQVGWKSYNCCLTNFYCDFSIEWFWTVSIKMYSTRYVDDLQWMTNLLQTLFKTHITTESRVRMDYFRKFSLFTEYLFKGFSFLFISSMCLFFVNPMYMYCVENEVVAIMPLFIRWKY